ncbi:LPXTG-motif cell wall anchor domain-containing protein [Halobacillus dabanensis]|uniref:LPXTG-motif cell wall anchor domain-containing protein n=1 Tax=Halobacillus dabanensis TaxID=240302 RepID=A0A1I3Q2I4_HALDA|nr:DUF6612 family protein [Halobacillus dabanensis]SFJ27860.1 LPXTG-motif cell wall anchor domain-containing protein [Halobacillus dabanensis]
MLKKISMSIIAFVVLFFMPMQISAADMSPEEVLQKSNEAMMNLDSYSITQSTESEIGSMGDDSQTQPLMTETKADVTLDPLAFYVQTNVANKTIEAYHTEEGYFSKTGDQGRMKLSGDSSEQMMQMMAEGQIKQAMPVADNMSVEEQDDAYVLTYEGDGEALLETSMNMLQQSLNGSDGEQGMQGMKGEILENTTINEVSYQITIDKETHYFTSAVMNLDMEAAEGAEGSGLSISTKTDVTIDNINGVGTIEVPQEVLDEAKPMEDTLGGGELPDTASSNPVYAMLGAILAFAAGCAWLYRRKTAA